MQYASKIVIDNFGAFCTTVVNKQLKRAIKDTPCRNENTYVLFVIAAISFKSLSISNVRDNVDSKNRSIESKLLYKACLLSAIAEWPGYELTRIIAAVSMLFLYLVRHNIR